MESTECKSAAEFLRAIDLVGDEWAGDPITGIESRWLFRGHADADWQLVPAAWRTDAKSVDRFAPFLSKVEHTSFVVERLRDLPQLDRAVIMQGMAESIAVSTFTTIASRVGIRVPPDQSVEDLKEALRRGDLRYVPTAAGALAQHYGIPTRLLDWTRDPRVAAFFAASDDGAPEAEFISVCAVDANKLALDTYREVDCPIVDNPNMGAQHGVFYDRTDADQLYVLSKGHWPAFGDGLPSEALRCFLLAAKHRVDLLARLERLHIAEVYLRPSRENVAAFVCQAARNGMRLRASKPA